MTARDSLPDRSSGVDAHGPECACVRCRGFTPGHEHSTKHGAYATLALRPRADALAQGLRAALGDGYSERFEAAIAGVAMIGARVERAMGALADDATPGEIARLDQDARGWMRLWLSGLASLGLTPASALRLRALASDRPSALEAYLDAKYPLEVES